MSAIRVQAHAKINLHLGILGRRPDGYHDVETVLQTLALHDTLICESCEGPFALTCDRPDVPIDATNLVWRAAVLLAQAAGREALAERGTRIRIDKRIPLQAGLGGGSADAAATLLALNRLWRLDVDQAILRRIGSRLGADVPFFFDGGTALGTGRGDEIRPLPDLPASTVVVVMPPFGVPTADAYRWFDAEAAAARSDAAGADAGEIRRWPEQADQWPAWLGRCRNDFEPVVATRYPAVGAAIARLQASGARLAALSGSGAAVFGLFDGEPPRLAEAPAGWRTFVSRTMDRASYLEQLVQLPT
jgi:4-diphosphocytidyl-2-C-methyl-D-erythritol kinase